MLSDDLLQLSSIRMQMDLRLQYQGNIMTES